MSEIKILNSENKKWCSGKDGQIKKWAIKDKSGDWWLVSGSEFPEKNAKKEQEIKKDEAPDFVFYFLSWFLGASIAFNIFSILKVVF